MNSLQQLARPLGEQLRTFESDHWVANSLLQKSVRRGSAELAQQAALTFMEKRGVAIWRRLVIIAFEDVGLACPETVALAALVGTDRATRRSIADDPTIAYNLAGILATAVKSRTAEHLITIAKYHPSLELQRAESAGLVLSEAIRAATDRKFPTLDRAVALWHSGVLAMRDFPRSARALASLLNAIEAAGVPSTLVRASEAAFGKTKDPIVLMAGLGWLLADGQGEVERGVLPQWLGLDGVPSYALDKHILVGRRAIRDLVKFNGAVRTCLARFVPGDRWHEAAYMAAFYTDAAPLDRKVLWQGANDLEQMAVEADLIRAGVTRDGVESVLRSVSENLGHLNQLRADAFFRARRSVGSACDLRNTP